MNKFLFRTFLLLFPLIGMAQNEPVLLDGVQAVVGGNMILKSDVDFEVERFKEQGYDNLEEVYCFVWREKLFEKLLIHNAELDSVEVTDKEIDAEVDKRLNYFLSQMNGSEEEFEKAFHKSVLEFKEEMRPVIEQNLLAQRMQYKLTADVQVSPSEVKEFYKSVPKDSIPIIEEKYKIAQIEIHPKANAYEEERLLKEMNEIRDQIVDQGRDFGLMAMIHSEDPGSKTQKGELGFISKQQLVPEFASVAYNLEPGEISDVIKSRYGYHIIQMIEKKGTLINVRHILKVPQIYSFDIELAKNRADSIYKVLQENPEKFGALATKFSDDEFTNSNGGVVANPQTGEEYFTSKDLPQQLFFAIKGLGKGTVSKPTLANLMPGKNAYRIVKLIDKTEFHVASIETDYEAIKSAALAKKKEQVMYKWIADHIEGTYLKLPEGMEECSALKVYYSYVESQKN